MTKCVSKTSISGAIAAGALCGLVCVANAAHAKAAKPNIVHIMVDDLGWQDIAAHKVDGKPLHETPHLDRLTRQGRRFTQAYSPTPVCAPSRVSFLRGQYPVHTGVYSVTGGQLPRPFVDHINLIPPYYLYGLPVEEPMIPESLKKAGYVSGHVAKWHAGGRSIGYPGPLDQGFDFGFFYEPDGRTRAYNDPELWNPKDGRKNEFNGSWKPPKPDRLSDFATDAPDDPFQVDADGRPFDKPTDLALGFIRKNKDKPFFLNYCPYYVHGPIATRDRTRLEHYCEKLGIPFPTDPGPANTGDPGHTNPYYASMVDTLDWCIGQIGTCLEQTDDPRNPGHKLIDNTYIIADADNGGWVGSPAERVTDNSPLRAGKMSSYEGGIRIPFIVRGPGVPAGSTCATPINLIDLYPTFMAIAGLENDPALKLDGCNILPLIQGKSDRVLKEDGTERESIYWFYPMESHMAVVMRKGEWKLVNNLGVGYLGQHAGVVNKTGVELFRVGDTDGQPGDLGETSDVGDKYPEVRDTMLAEVMAFMDASGASMPYRNLKCPQTSAADREASPKVLERGSEGDRVWVRLETGPGKVAVVEANLYYTLNPKPFDATRGNREEWFPAEATIKEGRVEARMPPGATHAAFCMRDANGFFVSSETLPPFNEVPHTVGGSIYLKHGYAYRPGVFAMVKLGKLARESSEKAGLDTTALDVAIAAAKAQLASEVLKEESVCEAIRALRAAIRGQKGIPEARHWALNRFPTDPLF